MSTTRYYGGIRETYRRQNARILIVVNDTPPAFINGPGLKRFYFARYQRCRRRHRHPLREPSTFRHDNDKTTDIVRVGNTLSFTFHAPYPDHRRQLNRFHKFVSERTRPGDRVFPKIE